MKRIFLIVSFLLLGSFFAQAQKYASVNTEYVFSNIPDYAQAEAQLNKQAATWQKELEDKFVEIDKLYKTYQQEAYLLPDNLKRKREDEIVNKEKEVKELQRQRFGAGGDLDKKRAELMKPIQERVYSAIERIANEKGYAFVFDRAGSNTVLFASSKYDISDLVLDMLGYSTQNKPTEDAEGSSPRKNVSNTEMKSPTPSRSNSGNNGKVDRMKQ